MQLFPMLYVVFLMLKTTVINIIHQNVCKAVHCVAPRFNTVATAAPHSEERGEQRSASTILILHRGINQKYGRILAIVGKSWCRSGLGLPLGMGSGCLAACVWPALTWGWFRNMMSGT